MEHILNCFEKYAVFEGRARRKEYWYFFLFLLIVHFLTLRLPAINAICSLITLVPSIAVACRRMHDVGKSGWFQLIPFYNLYLFCCDSEPSANKYGPQVK
ncbi:MAG: DUF805 domain-containing protein [Thermodesulfobacteriota bacterium]|nr:DUF805 domain-containing protein [Thermodesulfobacteriota bacterium]|tara:strand:- start:681 stop:980 length:300 start_codon:yes stop_codon:yes gene_type:complete